MAGAFPDPPGRRIAYNSDGTIVFWTLNFNPNTLDFASTSFLTTFNSELNQGYIFDTGGGILPDRNIICWFFPEPRDISGFAGHVTGGNGASIRNLYYSTDTTNGLDGNWTLMLDPYPYTATIDWTFRYRTGIVSLNGPSARAVRIQVEYGSNLSHGRVSNVHWYGTPAAGFSADKIIFIDESTGLEFDAAYDWGDIPRGVTLEKDIRVKNDSTNVIANDILLDFGSNSGTSDTWHTIKTAGGAFSDTLTIDSLDPGESSALLTTRIVVQADETVGQNVTFLKATVCQETSARPPQTVSLLHGFL